jgi:hypothetical protein
MMESNSFWPELCHCTVLSIIARASAHRVARAVERRSCRVDVDVGVFGASDWDRAARRQPSLDLCQVRDDAARRVCEASRKLASLMVSLTMQPKPL